MGELMKPRPKKINRMGKGKKPINDRDFQTRSSRHYWTDNCELYVDYSDCHGCGQWDEGRCCDCMISNGWRDQALPIPGMSDSSLGNDDNDCSEEACLEQCQLKADQLNASGDTDPTGGSCWSTNANCGSDASCPGHAGAGCGSGVAPPCPGLGLYVGFSPVFIT